MAPNVVQVPPSELAKAKQQLESERIQLAKQRREIQTSQNKAAAVKQAIGVAVALGTGALALYKLSEKKKSDEARLKSEEADREVKTSIAIQKFNMDKQKWDLERRTSTLNNFDALSETVDGGKGQMTAWKYAKDLGGGALSAAKTGSQIVKTGVQTVGYIGNNLGGMAFGTLAIYGARAYWYPETLSAGAFSAGRVVGANAVELPYRFFTGIPAGMYNSGTKIYDDAMKNFQRQNPSFRRAAENKTQIPPQYIPAIPNMSSRIPFTDTTFDEVIRTAINATRLPETGGGMPYVEPDISRFTKKKITWTQELYDDLQSQTPMERERILRKIPMRMKGYLERKFSRSK